MYVATWHRPFISNVDIVRIYFACQSLTVNEADRIWYLAVRAFGEKRVSPQVSAKKKRFMFTVSPFPLLTNSMYIVAGTMANTT